MPANDLILDGGIPIPVFFFGDLQLSVPRLRLVWADHRSSDLRHKHHDPSQGIRALPVFTETREMQSVPVFSGGYGHRKISTLFSLKNAFRRIRSLTRCGKGLCAFGAFSPKTPQKWVLARRSNGLRAISPAFKNWQKARCFSRLRQKVAYVFTLEFFKVDTPLYRVWNPIIGGTLTIDLKCTFCI